MQSRGDKEAIAVWNMLQTGSGGFDWRSLSFALAYFGIGDDVEGLVGRLLTIKSHRPPPKPKEE